MDEYKYCGVELVPEIFCELMMQLYVGEIFSRQECVDKIVNYHKAHGGLCNRKSYIDTFKRSTLLLRRKGYDVSNVSYGMWKIGKSDAFISYRSLLRSNSMSENDFEDEKCTEIGSGNETIYVYYYVTYRKYALLQGKSEWCCKIGMTTKNIWDRIYSQSATCFPEEPYVALIIRCNDARKLEQTIHNILKMKNKQIETAPGKEWFITSPSEVKSIYESIIM